MPHTSAHSPLSGAAASHNRHTRARTSCCARPSTHSCLRATRQNILQRVFPACRSAQACGYDRADTLSAARLALDCSHPTGQQMPLHSPLPVSEVVHTPAELVAVCPLIPPGRFPMPCLCNLPQEQALHAHTWAREDAPFLLAIVLAAAV